MPPSGPSLRASALVASFPTLSHSDRHLVSRFSYGITPVLARGVRAAGGAHAWWSKQLHPSRIHDATAVPLWNWYPSMHYSPEVLWQRQQNGQTQGYQVMEDFARWTLMKRMYSPRQLAEVMADFWSNLLHVPAPDDKSWPHRIRYDATIRRHALGTFEGMLHAAITHPAMGCYLDNAESTKYNPNENLGRELLELHTVGLVYSERDVKASMRLLTGYRVKIYDTYQAYYSPDDHYTGRVKVLGHAYGNQSADGRVTMRHYLHNLANHPATAKRVAQKLCVHFVSDAPSAKLVNAVAHTFRASGTDIKATLRTLIAHPEFKASSGRKVRTPVEDLVASIRVLGAKAHKPSADDSFANSILWQGSAMGQMPFNWPSPNGFPDSGASWSGVGRVLNSFGVHQGLAGGYYPTKDVTYHKTTHWLPKLPARFEDVVDHMSRMLLARPATKTLESAIATRTGFKVGRRLTSTDLADYQVIRMIETILDAPSHMTR